MLLLLGLATHYRSSWYLFMKKLFFITWLWNNIIIIISIKCYIFGSSWQERRKALKSGGAKSLNRIDLYGKNSIPMEKLYNLWGPWPPWPPRFLRLCMTWISTWWNDLPIYHLTCLIALVVLAYHSLRARIFVSTWNHPGWLKSVHNSKLLGNNFNGWCNQAHMHLTISVM